MTNRELAETFAIAICASQSTDEPECCRGESAEWTVDLEDHRGPCDVCDSPGGGEAI